MLAILQWDFKDVEMVIKACHISAEVRSEHLYMCCCSPGSVAHRATPRLTRSHRQLLETTLNSWRAQQELKAPSAAGALLFLGQPLLPGFEVPTQKRTQWPRAGGISFPLYFYMAEAKPWFHQPTRDLWITATGCVSAIFTCKSSRPT